MDGEGKYLLAFVASLAVFVLATLLGILLALGYSAYPAIDKFGLGFFTTNVWNPVKSEFGALAPIYLRAIESLAARVSRSISRTTSKASRGIEAMPASTSSS